MLAIIHGTVNTISDGIKPDHTLLIREGKIQGLTEPGSIPPG
jgi:hypothetical protein